MTELLPSLKAKRSFLDAASSNDWAKVDKILIAQPDLVNVQLAGQFSALHYAAKHGGIGPVNLLLKHKANIALKTDDGRTPADVASTEIVKCLLWQSPEPSADLSDHDHGQVCFIRHAQALHNANLKFVGERDPNLTAKGLMQCEMARYNWAAEVFDEADLLVVSPLQRALQTISILNGQNIDDSRFCISPFCSEFWSAKCDEGTPKEELLQYSPWIAGWSGFDALPDNWWPSQKETDKNSRVCKFLEFLCQRPEKKIVVVSHGGFLSRIIGFHLPNVGHHVVSLPSLREKLEVIKKLCHKSAMRSCSYFS